VFAVDPHQGTLGAIDSDVGLSVQPASLASFRRHVAEAGVESVVVPVLQHSFEVEWNRPISLLYVDGLHDALSVKQDTEHFLDWVVGGGAVAFHDYMPTFPGVQQYVDHLLDQGSLRLVEIADSLIVLEKVAATPVQPRSDVVDAWRHRVGQLQEAMASGTTRLRETRGQLSRSLELVNSLSNRTDVLAQDLAALRATHETGLQSIARLDDLLQLSRTENLRLEHRLRAAVETHERDMAAIWNELQDATATARHHAGEAAALRNSLTWRWTAPVRAVVDRLLALKWNAGSAPTSTSLEKAERAIPRPPSNSETTPGSVPLSEESFAACPEPGVTLPSELCHGFLVISDALPTPEHDSGSFRLVQLLLLLARQADAVTFVADFVDGNECANRTSALTDAGIQVLAGRRKALSHLETHGARYRYVWLSRPDVAHAYLFDVRAKAIHARVIYDTVDLHWLRMTRQYELTGDERTLQKAEHYRMVERFNAESSDVVVAISEEERQLLRMHTNAERVEVIPNIHPDQAEAHLTEWRDRAGLLFVGGFWHSPNVDAVRYFVSEVFPLVLARAPGIVLTVIGSNMPEEIHSLGSESVHCLGHVPDMAEHFSRARVSIAPLRYGAGVKGKIGQSMSYGVPVVTTTIGAEGLDLRDGSTALIADDQASFADAIVRIHESETLWRHVSRMAAEHIRDRCSPSVVVAELARMFPRETTLARPGETDPRMPAASATAEGRLT
jgi:glycosyltransferase involved in cell wall biosynthesis